MPRKPPRQTTSSTRRRRANTRKRSWLRPLIGLAMLGLLLVGGYTLYLSHEVRVKFEGKRWAVPARVYAQPLELFAGAPLSQARLRDERKALGFRQVRTPAKGGQWSSAGGRYLVQTRSFLFWDGEEPGRLLELRFNGDQLADLNDAATGQPLEIVRLEPTEIGSIYPSHREDRVLVRRDQLPDALVGGLLAVEDRKFYSHHGIDPLGIARALWANVRSTVEDFLFNEWSNGRLLGGAPKAAYFVRCDRSTMTQNDIDNGRLVCLVGVAPLRPAEFVVFRIGQKTADA